LNEILITWELSDKEVDPICEAIRIGLEDGSVKAREVARTAYVNLFKLLPAKAEKVKADLPKGLQIKLKAALSDAEENPLPIQLFESQPKEDVEEKISSSLAITAGPETHEERAALAIQASMRGLMQRRRSVVRNPFAEISSSFGGVVMSSSSAASPIGSKPGIGGGGHTAALGKPTGRLHSPSRLPKSAVKPAIQPYTPSVASKAPSSAAPFGRGLASSSSSSSGGGGSRPASGHYSAERRVNMPPPAPSNGNHMMTAEK
jgi:hypothetical protein